jgi:hypothetical protein
MEAYGLKDVEDSTLSIAVNLPENLTAATTKSSLLWYITSCSPLNPTDVSEIHIK